MTDIKQQLVEQLTATPPKRPHVQPPPASHSRAKPFVKWVGGKRGLMDKLTARLPSSYKHYYEPFVGGGALFFELAPHPHGATLCDVNRDLVITYKVIQLYVEDLIAQLEAHAARHEKDYYYAVRSQHHLTDPVAFAARLLYLNKTCYNGLWRVNSKGEFNVPMGRYKNPAIVAADNLRACHRTLQNVAVHAGQFDQIQPTTGDFVYFDPPYDPVNAASFTKYSKDDFDRDDQTRLRDFAVRLHQQGVHVMLSNSDTPFIRALYDQPGFCTRRVMALRAVNANASARGKVGEVLITNY